MLKEIKSSQCSYYTFMLCSNTFAPQHQSANLPPPGNIVIPGVLASLLNFVCLLSAEGSFVCRECG